MVNDNNSHIFIYWDDEPTNLKTTKTKMDKSDSFADFVDELTNSAANANACSIDNDDCEACGS